MTLKYKMDPIKQTPKETLEQALKQNDFSLEKSQIKKILEYVELILEWNSHINLTAHNNIQLIVFKDIIDCMYLNKYILTYLKVSDNSVIARSKATKQSHELSREIASLPLVARNDLRIVDFGCGAGFIGVILSILETSPYITFVESNRKKLNFVKQACRSLNLTNNTYINTRAELISTEYHYIFNVSVSRATWKSKDWLDIATRYTAPDGYLIRMAGIEKNYSSEIKIFQGLERKENFFYTIKPENFKRHLEIFKKL